MFTILARKIEICAKN